MPVVNCEESTTPSIHRPPLEESEEVEGCKKDIKCGLQ